jgi:N-acetylglucosamine-6-phosphate deacetylase
MKAIVNGAVYTPTRIIPQGVVLVEEGRIVAVGSSAQVTPPAHAQIVDAQGEIVCPGLIDIHVHGGDGGDCSAGTAEAVRATARRHLRAGSTSLLATTASAPLPTLWRACDAIVDVMGHPLPGEARVLGIHWESNFFSVAQRGAHPAELLAMPSAADRERLLGYLPALARLTIAPEREGAMEMIREFSQRGVLVSGGHSDALYEQVCRAMDAGMRHITHLWSGMSLMRRIGPKRYSGMLEAALVEDGLTGEIIADGYHLPTSLIKMAYRLKGADGLCLVSDAMQASGLGPGQYGVGAHKVMVEEGGGVAITSDGLSFAGSISTMAQCLQQIVQVVGVSLQEGLTMATLTPARIAGLDDQVGQLTVGRRADILILDRATLQPRTVMLGGEVVEQQP